MGNPENGWERVAAETLRQERARQPTIIVWPNGPIPDLPFPTPHDPYEEAENDAFLHDIYPEWTL